MIVAEVTSKYRSLRRFRKLGDHRERSVQVFHFGSSHVEILVVSLVVQITDVRDDKGVEQVADIIGSERSGSTCVLIVADGLLRQILVLCTS